MATKEKKNYLSRTAMVELMKNSKGHFMTVTFITNEGDKRVMNCKVRKDVILTNLGYLNVNENNKGIKSVNTRTLLTLKINGTLYTAKIS